MICTIDISKYTIKLNVDIDGNMPKVRSSIHARAVLVGIDVILTLYVDGRNRWENASNTLTCGFRSKILRIMKLYPCCDVTIDLRDITTMKIVYEVNSSYMCKESVPILTRGHSLASLIDPLDPDDIWTDEELLQATL